MVASLVGDPARANILTALMTGRALTASELAHQAGVTPQTASSHLSKLEAGGLIEPEKQGRHRYYRLSDPDVAGVLEGLAGLAARAGHMRVRTGPKDPALRRARICYDHLAGDLGVQMLDSLKKQRLVRQKKQDIELTAGGARFLENALQISGEMLAHPRRPVCKACLDWSERRHHLAGTLGAAIMTRFTELKWAARDAPPAAASSISAAPARSASRRCSAITNSGAAIRGPVVMPGFVPPSLFFCYALRVDARVAWAKIRSRSHSLGIQIAVINFARHSTSQIFNVSNCAWTIMTMRRPRGPIKGEDMKYLFAAALSPARSRVSARPMPPAVAASASIVVPMADAAPMAAPWSLLPAWCGRRSWWCPAAAFARSVSAGVMAAAGRFDR